MGSPATLTFLHSAEGIQEVGEGEARSGERPAIGGEKERAIDHVREREREGEREKEGVRLGERERERERERES